MRRILTQGDSIVKEIDFGIRTYDKMILVCSEASLSSWWVEDELNRILAKEREH